MVGTDFPANVCVWGGRLRKALLPVAVRPEHKVVGPPLVVSRSPMLFHVFRESDRVWGEEESCTSRGTAP